MKNFSILLFSILAFALTSCDDDDDDVVVAPSSNGTLDVHFHPVVGMEDLVIGDNYNVNGESISWSLSQFYISDVKVWKDASGNEKESIKDAFKLVKPNHADVELGSIPAGKYYGIEFYVGIADSAVNHADPSLASGDLAPQNPGMHWSWNTGYIFLKIEGTRNADQSNFEYHIGTLKMATKVSIQKEFTITENQSNSLMLMVDHGAILNGVDFATENSTHTMDNMPLALKITSNLQNSFK